MVVIGEILVDEEGDLDWGDGSLAQILRFLGSRLLRHYSKMEEKLKKRRKIRSWTEMDSDLREMKMGVESKKEGVLGKTREGAREMNNLGTREFLKYLGNVYIRVSYNWAFFLLMKTINWAHSVKAQIGHI